MSRHRVSVMVVEDSPLSRELLTLVLNGEKFPPVIQKVWSIADAG